MPLLQSPKFKFTSFFTVILKRPATPQKTTQKTTELEEKIITLINKKSTITRDEIAKELGISSNTVKEYLNKLKEKGLLARIGGRKHGYWEARV